MDIWSSVTQVFDLTGVSVTEAELARAEAVIGISCGRDPDTTPLASLSVRDRSWLGKVVAYQAAWMQAQPDMFTRSAVTSYGDNGSHSPSPRPARRSPRSPGARWPGCPGKAPPRWACSASPTSPRWLARSAAPSGTTTTAARRPMTGGRCEPHPGAEYLA